MVSRRRRTATGSVGIRSAPSARWRLASIQCNLAAQALVMQSRAHSPWRGCMGLWTSLLPSSPVPLVYCRFDASDAIKCRLLSWLLGCRHLACCTLQQTGPGPSRREGWQMGDSRQIAAPHRVDRCTADRTHMSKPQKGLQLADGCPGCKERSSWQDCAVAAGPSCLPCPALRCLPRSTHAPAACCATALSS